MTNITLKLCRWMSPHVLEVISLWYIYIHIIYIYVYRMPLHETKGELKHDTTGNTMLICTLSTDLQISMGE